MDNTYQRGTESGVQDVTDSVTGLQTNDIASGASGLESDAEKDANLASGSGNEALEQDSGGSQDQTGQQVLHGVKIGSIGLLLPADIPTEVALTPVVCPIPLSPPWIRGVTTLRGIAAPIFNVDSFFDHITGKPGNRAVLLIGQGDSMVGIEIDELPMRVTLTEDQKLLNFPPLPVSVQPFSTGCYRNSDGLWIEWDIDGFFHAMADVARRS